MGDHRYAILGDIHSNWPALEAVMTDAFAQNVTQFLCVGDVVGYNAEPVRCLETIMELGCVTVMGNHDQYCSSSAPLDDFHPLAAEVVRWTRNQLNDQHLTFLRDLKFVRRVAGFTLVHSTLDMPEKWGYVFDALEADANFNYQSTALCFHGHTHVPVVFERQKTVHRMHFSRLQLQLGTRYFINVGSVGQPRDGDPRSAYAVFDPQLKTVELRRVPYDVEATQAGIRNAGLPERLARRLVFGK
ncbi:MAG: metallophosphatase family protein [Lentisphaerae bacterium]|nr:metallophosphatase family protein [Lentisphaerota bacterium]